MAGRRPKPTKLKILAGNPGKRKLPENEPQPETGKPDPPVFLCPFARTEWDRITGELEAIGLLTKMDAAALEAYCVVYGRWAEAESVLKTKGLLVKDTSGNIKPSPMLSIANQCLSLMHKYLTEFGMTPSSRARVRGKDAKPEKSKYGSLKSG